jgi:hypothetical protein
VVAPQGFPAEEEPDDNLEAAVLQSHGLLAGATQTGESSSTPSSYGYPLGYEEGGGEDTPRIGTPVTGGIPTSFEPHYDGGADPITGNLTAMLADKMDRRKLSVRKYTQLPANRLLLLGYVVEPSVKFGPGEVSSPPP